MKPQNVPGTKSEGFSDDDSHHYRVVQKLVQLCIVEQWRYNQHHKQHAFLSMSQQLIIDIIYNLTSFDCSGQIKKSSNYY